MNMDQALQKIKKILYRGLKILYPPRCAVCDRLLMMGDADVCRVCSKKLPWIHQPYCMKCGKMLDNDRQEYCRDCMKYFHKFDRGIAAFQYTGGIRASVGRMKFQGRRDSLDFFADAMMKQGETWIRRWQPQVLLPVPSHWTKKNRRGFNQSELLAEKISERTGIPVEKKLVKKRRDTRNQKELSLEERRKNLRGAFVLTKEAAGLERVLIIDDIYTTGSTMDAMAELLRENGVKHIYFLTLCIGKG